MAHWRSMIDRDYLGAWDLVGPDGQPKHFTLVIKKVESKLLKTRETPKGKRKVTIWFERATKGMVGNSVNCLTIEGMYGPDTDAWVGKAVTLYPTTTEMSVKQPDGKFKRQQVPCIRVKPMKPTAAAEAVPDREVDPAMRAQQDEAFERESGEEG